MKIKDTSLKNLNSGLHLRISKLGKNDTKMIRFWVTSEWFSNFWIIIV